MRRLLVVAGVLIVVAGVGTAYYVSKHHYGGNVKGTSTEFVPTETAVPPQPHESSRSGSWSRPTCSTGSGRRYGRRAGDAMRGPFSPFAGS